MSRDTTQGRARPAQMAACIVLALSASAATANGGTQEEIGELMGDLMFHADLMSSLDTLCPNRSPADDWRAVVRQLPAHARTLELRELSRRLTADASRAMVKASGGCTTRDYAQLYAETRREFEALRKRWAWYSV